MNKPQPQKQVVVEKAIGLLYIHCANTAAKTWVLEQAKEFGSAADYNNSIVLLRPNLCYDMAEVKAYLESYEEKAA